MSISNRLQRPLERLQMAECTQIPSDGLFFPNIMKSKDKKGFRATAIIGDCLFLGDIHDALDVDEVRSKGITHVVSCCPERKDEIPPAGGDKEKKIEYLFVDVKDHIQQDLMGFFKEVIDFIRDAIEKDENNKILVHCAAGISRSATFVIAFLSDFFKIEPLFALEMVSELREKVCPNLAFLLQLKNFFDSHAKIKKDGKD